MTGMDWIYGPEMRGEPPNVALRGLVLEPDTVREILDLVEAETGAATLSYAADTGAPQPIDPKKIETTPEWQLRRLRIDGGGDSGLYVALQDGGWPSVQASSGYTELVRQIAHKMLEEGQPRPDWRNRAHWLPTFAAFAVLATWAWVLIDLTPPVSVAAFGTLVAAACTEAFVLLRRQMLPSHPFRSPGHRIRTMSRLETRQRLADRNAQVKVGAITGVVGLIIGAVGKAVIGRF